MARHGKKYLEAVKKYARQERYPLERAVELVKELSYANFDETVELSVKVNLKKGQTVRGTVTLPHKFGQEKRILVFARGDKAEEAREAGATYVGDTDLVEKIQQGWLDFDVAVATPDMMKEVGKLGPILGRRGLMPNPKVGTVTMDIKGAVENLKQGQVEFRADKTGVVHLAVGKVSMEPEKIVENVNVALDEMRHRRPADTKGAFIKSVTLSSTMGPGVKVKWDER
ncbi:ribosomal protein L1 [Spirochaeta thermophila DSM 6578]|uniref:Large ribosomal subunit protein uL1 n=1 Tax=Winmispira thermophila (strain ATCC 700085 / DSM 6578 / Z-1203) TaxID=869211 RepID=G0GF90_WINT7|nr:50S ribosomal protein L1 [Spirochaeta thermophila]AEJ60789.1 ribosomal protein L1 [Spirochaeta thermophila DSM 6578]